MNPLSWIKWLGAAIVAALGALTLGRMQGRKSQKQKQDSDTLKAVRKKKEIEDETSADDIGLVRDRLRKPKR